MHTFTLLAIALLVATGADASSRKQKLSNSPLDRPSAEDFSRIDKAAMDIGREYETEDDPPANDRWNGLTRGYGISKGHPVCLDGADGQSTCWTPTRFLNHFGYKHNVQAQNATAHPSDVALQPFDPEDSHPDRFLKVVTEHPNIVKLIAHGQCKHQNGSLIAKCSALAVEMPAMIVIDMLREFVRNTTLSPPLEKSQVRRIVTDVAKGLQHIHTSGWLYDNMGPASIYLYKEPGSGQFTAKLGDFRSAQKLHTNPPIGTTDIYQLGYNFLDVLGAVFYYKAKKYTDMKPPCSHPSPEDIWLVSMCDMVANLDRISQKLPRKGNQWTLEQVLADPWLNSTD